MEKKFTPTEKKLEDLSILIDGIVEELSEFLSLDTCAIPEEGMPKDEEDK